MKTPKRPVNLVDLLDDIEACYDVVVLVVYYDGVSEFYDEEDIEFVNPELFERMVESYEVENYTQRKVRVHIVLKGE